MPQPRELTARLDEEEEAKRDGPLEEADVIIHQLLGLGTVSPWYGSTADFKEGHGS